MTNDNYSLLFFFFLCIKKVATKTKMRTESRTEAMITTTGTPMATPNPLLRPGGHKRKKGHCY